MFWKYHKTNKHIKCSCYFTLTFIIIIIIINNIIFGLDQFLPAYCSTVSQTADVSAGVEVLSCECRTSAMLKSLSHSCPSGWIFPSVLFVVSESVTQRNPSPVLGNSMLQSLLEEPLKTVTWTHTLPQKSPPPFILCLPFQAVSLRNGRCVFMDLMGVILTQQRESEMRRVVWKGGWFWVGSEQSYTGLGHIWSNTLGYGGCFLR